VSKGRGTRFALRGVRIHLSNGDVSGALSVLSGQSPTLLTMTSYRVSPELILDIAEHCDRATLAQSLQQLQDTWEAHMQ